MTPARLPTDLRAVVLDVGETLVDESRAWGDLARAAGVTPFTLTAAIGAVMSRGGDHRQAWELLGVAPPASVPDIRPEDLYPDALECLRSARAAGLVVGVAGNQPGGAEQALRSAGADVDFIATSATWGVAKPSPEFFERVVVASGVPAHQVLHVGDRLDNDIRPARAAGLRTAWLRRGPWALLHEPVDDDDVADLELASLSELSQALLAGGQGRGR